MSGTDRQREGTTEESMDVYVCVEAKQISCTHIGRPVTPLSRSVACPVHLASSVLHSALYTAPRRDYTYT